MTTATATWRELHRLACDHVPPGFHLQSDRSHSQHSVFVSPLDPSTLRLRIRVATEMLDLDTYAVIACPPDLRRQLRISGSLSKTKRQVWLRHCRVVTKNAGERLVALADELVEDLDQPFPCPGCRRPPDLLTNFGRHRYVCSLYGRRDPATTRDCLRPVKPSQQTEAAAISLWNAAVLLYCARKALPLPDQLGAAAVAGELGADREEITRKSFDLVQTIGEESPHALTIDSVRTSHLRALRFLDASIPPNTRAAYESDWTCFATWCRLTTGISPDLPVDPDILFLFTFQHLDLNRLDLPGPVDPEGLRPDVDQQLVEAGVKRSLGPLAVSTVERRVSAIRSLHRRAGLSDPASHITLELLRAAARIEARSGGHPSPHRAIILPTLEALLHTTRAGSLRDIRDAALLFVGWSSGGRRRSEIAAARIENLTQDGRGGYLLLLPYHKVKSAADGDQVPILGRAAHALSLWLSKIPESSGPIFRPITKDDSILPRALQPRAVLRIVRRRAQLAGLNPSHFGAHSLRSGFLTQAGLDGVSLQEAMALSLHRSVQQAQRYHRSSIVHNRAARLADLNGCSSL